MSQNDLLKAFICHSSTDSEFVVEVAKHIERNLDGIFYYEDYQQSNESFVMTMNKALDECNVMIIFLGKRLSAYQRDEISTAYRMHQKQHRNFFAVLLNGQEDLPPELNVLGNYPVIRVDKLNSASAYDVAKKIVNDYLKRPWRSDDDLPLNPHLFDYEKDVIEYFIKKNRIEKNIAELQDKLENGDEADKGKVTESLIEQKKEYEPILEKPVKKVNPVK